MEKNIKEKCETYCNDFKKNIQEWFETNNVKIIDQDGNNSTTTFIQYMLDFPNLSLEKDDFKKRKRVKNTVPNFCRCSALKSDGTRCSRRRKGDDTLFCGTHIKGVNFGVVTDDDNVQKVEKIKLWIEEINGISQYIDDNGNVYSTEDIMNNVEVPRIICHYTKNSDGTYHIKQD